MGGLLDDEARDDRYCRTAQERTFRAHSVEKDTVMARTRHRSLDCSPGCAVEATLQLIDGKWKGVILYHLLDEAPEPEGALRFNALRRRMPNVTQRMLTNQLRELEADGLVHRTVYAEVPPRVEYRLTARGRTLEPVIRALKAWGDAYAAPVAAAKAA
ncbi:transcriptional regulator [Methylobacterium nonmethylotrophicum]|uniref:Transcriptional regulator n=2 Tax=Methylobacterium nonmethylotrophicum TaxID=1141884 RepID=A0A4Z0NT05_9HYPH|nr:transcriptional regulator [Methylobacterium nonmethylotrophicum]